MEDWEADIRVAETRRRVRFEEKSGREPRKVRGIHHKWPRTFNNVHCVMLDYYF